jgi:hypothetical protein
MMGPEPKVAAALFTSALLTLASNAPGAETLVQVGSSLPQPRTLVLLGAGLVGVFWLTWLRRRS